MISVRTHRAYLRLLVSTNSTTLRNIRQLSLYGFITKSGFENHHLLGCGQHRIVSGSGFVNKPFDLQTQKPIIKERRSYFFI